MAEEIRAPLAGTVSSVLVEPGAKVDADDELLVIEAMKMENLVYSPCAGAVTTVNVKAGDRIEAGDLLLVIN
jgi:acetyl-CoA carboxylase biotin carboxyl carrier protein